MTMRFWEGVARWAGKPFRGSAGMLTCQEQVDLLGDYLDGTLQPKITRALERHLEGCPECLNFIKTYRATTAWVGELTYEEMPDELKARLASFLKARIRQEKASSDQR